MRALLVVNPKATATTRRVRDVLIRALGSDLKVDVEETARRGHAVDLGRRARADGLDVVVVLGGDGTVNEVVNGLLAEGVDPEGPALAVVPGGSTNVFTRSLGIPTDPVEATSELLDALRGGRSRPLGLGRANGRYFTFTAGLGLDAQAVRAVERRRLHGRRPTPGRYVRAALAQYFFDTDHRHGALRLEVPGEEPVDDLFLGIVTNTTPWTYLGRREITVTPRASFEAGLDLFAMRRLGMTATLHAASGMLSRRRPGPRGRAVVNRHDLARFRLVGDEPLAFQLDGDYLGECDALTLEAAPNALRVVV